LITGQIGITLAIAWAEPENPSDPSHLEASETEMQFGLGWYAHSIFVNGEYPPIMRQKVYITLAQQCILVKLVSYPVFVDRQQE
jgi:beta-glucosidase/6-phospho-beta-glucosidase/beta-galactosidase